MVCMKKIYTVYIYRIVLNKKCDDSVPVLWFNLTHLTRSRQEMNLNIRICQSIEIHRLQSLEEARLRITASHRRVSVKVTIMDVFNNIYIYIYKILSRHVSKYMSAKNHTSCLTRWC